MNNVPCLYARQNNITCPRNLYENCPKAKVFNNDHDPQYEIFLVQLGSPQTPQIKDVRSYLKEFLADKRVVDLPRWFWLPLLYFVILVFRPKKSAALYQRIWKEGNFPLRKYSESFASKVQSKLGSNYRVHMNYLIDCPRFSCKFFETVQSAPEAKYFIIPMFPQTAESTTASVYDTLHKSLAELAVMPNFTFNQNFHRSIAFIDSSWQLIDEQLNAHIPQRLILSFHGIPQRCVTSKGDLYLKHCVETFLLLKNKIQQKYPELKVSLSFQSQFGKEKWLGPNTEKFVEQCIDKNEKDLGVYAPSFVVDCLESLDELGHELKEFAAVKGASLHAFDCLNDREVWVEKFSAYIQGLIVGQQLEYEVSQSESKQICQKILEGNYEQ